MHTDQGGGRGWGLLGMGKMGNKMGEFFFFLFVFGLVGLVPCTISFFLFFVTIYDLPT
jgi:hypothetical protein